MALGTITPEQAKFLSGALGCVVPPDKIAPRVDPVDHVSRSTEFATEFTDVKTADSLKTADNPEGKYRTKEFSEEEKRAATWASDSERLRQGDAALQGQHNYVMEAGTGHTKVFDNAGQDTLADGTVLKHHHSSPVSGADVIGAGTLTAADGKVTKVRNDSGHYLPQIGALQNTVTELLRQRVMLDTTMTDLTGQGETPETKPLFDLHRQVQKGLLGLEGRQDEIGTLHAMLAGAGDEALDDDETRDVQNRIRLISHYLDSVAQGYAALRKAGIAPRNAPIGDVEYKRKEGKGDISGFAFRRGEGTVTQTMSTKEFLTGGTDDEQKRNHAAAMEELKLVRASAEERQVADAARREGDASRLAALAAKPNAEEDNASHPSTSASPLEPPVKGRVFPDQETSKEIAAEYVREAGETPMEIIENTPEETNANAVAVALAVLDQIRELSDLLDPPEPELELPPSGGPGDDPGDGLGDGPPPTGDFTQTPTLSSGATGGTQPGNDPPMPPQQGGYVDTEDDGYVTPTLGAQPPIGGSQGDGNRNSDSMRDDPEPLQNDEPDDFVARMQREREAEPEAQRVARELQWPFLNTIRAIQNTMLFGTHMVMPQDVQDGITHPGNPQAEAEFNALRDQIAKLQKETIRALQTLEQRIRDRGEGAMIQSTLDRVTPVVNNHMRVFEKKGDPIVKRMGELAAAARNAKI